MTVWQTMTFILLNQMGLQIITTVQCGATTMVAVEALLSTTIYVILGVMPVEMVSGMVRAIFT